MKANKLPKSDSYDSSYHRQSAGSQAQQTNSSQTHHFSANDDYLFASQQEDKGIAGRADNTASNDANYLTDSLSASTKPANTKASSTASDISCGYKKAPTKDAKHTTVADKSLKSTSAKSDDITAAEVSFENRLFADNHRELNERQNSQSQDNNQKHKAIKTNNKKNNITTTNPVSERVFMSSLLKHTGIALAIIIPLAAFSAYAATPAQTINSNMSKDQATKINIDPKTIIHKSATEPTTVDSVDLDKYVGTWYEIGRLPMYFQRNCASDVTANYTQKTDGSGIIVTNKCLDKDGSAIVAEGLAKPADSTGSKLKVTFLPSWIRWLPVGRADYWVLARDDDYQTALVGTPDKEYLWLLARSPNISQQTYAKYRQIAQEQGYNLKAFTLTPHANQTVNLIP